jgi:hypothetical protein
MEGFQYIGVIIDTVLMGLVIMLAYRYTRPVQLPAALPSFDTKEMEQSLRKVITDAEEASHELNRTLQKRQKSLEQILFDLENVEQRAAKSLSEADSKTTALRNAIEAAENTEIRPAQRNSNSFNKIEVISEASQIGPIKTIEALEPVSVPVSARANQRVNIFGEVIEGDSIPAQPLARRIEVEKDFQASAKAAQYNDNNLRAGIHKIYDTARDLLSAGHSVAAVCAATKLPAGTVRKIEELVVSQMPQQVEPAVEQISAPIPQKRDPRLGALGDMRRSREVI